MLLTADQLIQIMPSAKLRAPIFVPWLNKYCAQYGIDTPLRMAAFLAQAAHESCELKFLRELGSDAYLEKYDTGPIAKRLGNTPGDDGDGQKYRGRGIFQVTGHDNYLTCSKALFGDDRLLATPELLEEPQYAVQSACWYWQSRNINVPADKGDFVGVTRKINPGLLHQAEREAYYKHAVPVLGAA